MNMETAAELRLAVADAVARIPEPPPLIFSDSSTQLPEASPHIICAIRDGLGREVGAGLIQEDSVLELGIFSPRAGDALIRSFADHLEGELEAMFLPSGVIYPASRAMQIGDTAQTLAIVLTFPVTTYR